jgi:hypothetical protein
VPFLLLRGFASGSLRANFLDERSDFAPLELAPPEAEQPLHMGHVSLLLDGRRHELTRPPELLGQACLEQRAPNGADLGDVRDIRRAHGDALSVNDVVLTAITGGLRTLLADAGEPTPVFDVHLLGMGGEGHVNSLFPDTPAVRETHRMVVGVPDSPKPPPRRITLTLPAVRRSRDVWLVVSGAAKADAVARAVAGADPVDLPAAGAIGLQNTLWLLDAAAARGLSSPNV